MRFLSISLKNFRCFPDLSAPVEFHHQMTVFAAVNGRGKSAILDAMTLALSPFSSQFEHGDTKNFSKADATLKQIEIANALKTPESQFPVSVEASLKVPDAQVVIKRILSSAKGRARREEEKPLVEYAQSLIRQLTGQIAGDSAPMPVISYYGTGRLHAQKRLMEKRRAPEVHNPGSRTMGYQHCLSAESTYKYFVEWMGKTTLAQLQEMDPAYRSGSPDAHRAKLEGVSRAVQCVLNGQQWNDIRYSVAEKELTVHDGYTRLPLVLLSDGLRSVIAMIGDLAYRCMLLNPHFGAAAPRQTPGIVLIDEIEMHLHPAWQQKVLQQLMDAFPKVQFICTTHSPQVLSTVRPESIRTIHEGGRVTSPNCKTYGAESKRVLEELMLVDSRPWVLEKELEEFVRITDAGDWESARYRELRKLLDTELGSSDPALMDAEIKRTFQQLSAE
jgi:predicted ATP-binding protein involved in virulence